MSTIKGITSALATPDFKRLDTISKIAAFDSVCGIAFNTAGNDDDWSAVYDEVFGGDIGKAAETILVETGLRPPEYDDPDTSYREDVLAWAAPIRECFQSYVEGHRKIHEILEG